MHGAFSMNSENLACVCTNFSVRSSVNLLYRISFCQRNDCSENFFGGVAKMHSMIFINVLYKNGFYNRVFFIFIITILPSVYYIVASFSWDIIEAMPTKNIYTFEALVTFKGLTFLQQSFCPSFFEGIYQITCQKNSVNVLKKFINHFILTVFQSFHCFSIKDFGWNDCFYCKVK